MFKKAVSSIIQARRDHATVAAEHRDDEREVERQALEFLTAMKRVDDECENLRASLNAAYARRRAFEEAKRQLTHAFDVRHAKRERELVTLADRRIEAFLVWIQAERDALPRKLVEYDVRQGRDGHGRPRVSSASNYQALGVIMTALVAARERAVALQFITVPDVGEALEEIRRSIPSVDEAEASLKERQDGAA